MSDAAAIRGNFSDFRLIKTRSVIQLVIELEIEAADAALAALGGIPQPGQERPVAVARLAPTVFEKQLRDSVELERKKQSLAQQAGALCNDARFRAFLAEIGGYDGIKTLDLEMAVDDVRSRCRVASRAELDVDPEAAERWRNLRADFLAWERM